VAHTPLWAFLLLQRLKVCKEQNQRQLYLSLQKCLSVKVAATLFITHRNVATSGQVWIENRLKKNVFIHVHRFLIHARSELRGGMQSEVVST